eukprot:Plantae.Rhodophyta-Palmaria_palmata.ctg2964.p1 GENE.Plantae.Rhodophyta-Palmaria_palmata.ctg2964~~Plantae.Rhodophyta-Palmaria_palmata.ctg2964.p1  ORF type:complete len:106 (-),score=9.99 Plantae.Rhodophyta-Palmaria_palmata.ctg2964:28-345(-)
MITCEAARFAFMGSPILKPVSASHSSCRYLLPFMYSYAMDPVLSDEIASIVAYLLPAVLRKESRLAFPVIQESKDTRLLSSLFSTMNWRASGYSLQSHASLSLNE